jgi:hypothetical protein
MRKFILTMYLWFLIWRAYFLYSLYYVRDYKVLFLSPLYSLKYTIALVRGVKYGN